MRGGGGGRHAFDLPAAGLQSCGEPGQAVLRGAAGRGIGDQRKGASGFGGGEKAGDSEDEAGGETAGEGFHFRGVRHSEVRFGPFGGRGLKRRNAPPLPVEMIIFRNQPRWVSVRSRFGQSGRAASFRRS